jgi:hypothetical protein
MIKDCKIKIPYCEIFLFHKQNIHAIEIAEFAIQRGNKHTAWEKYRQ